MTQSSEKVIDTNRKMHLRMHIYLALLHAMLVVNGESPQRESSSIHWIMGQAVRAESPCCFLLKIVNITNTVFEQGLREYF